MLTPFDRKQQAAERAGRAAAALAALPAAQVPQSCDWDAALAALAGPPALPPTVTHKPPHGGYPS